MTSSVRPEPAPRPRSPPPALRGESLQTPRTATGRAYSGLRHLRAALVLLGVAVLLLAVAYPLALVGFGQVVNPHGANGSLTHNPNGSVNGSKLLPPNTTSTVGGLSPLPPSPTAGRPGGRSEMLSYVAWRTSLPEGV